MHTIKIILAGLALLAICLVLGRFSGSSRGMSIATLIFLPLWLLIAAGNMYFGVKGAGYSVTEELPVFLLVFALPALMAMLLRWKLR